MIKGIQNKIENDVYRNFKSGKSGTYNELFHNERQIIQVQK